MNKSAALQSTEALRIQVERLSAKERECLRRWMKQQTAKQIALELGVSHHAIEKRLKTARVKLGVSSSIEAAQMLAEVEGYGLTAYQPSELGDGRQEPRLLRHRFKIAGAFFMILISAVVLSIGLQTLDADTYPAPTPAGDDRAVVMLEGDAIPHMKASPEAIRGFISNVFDRTDEDGSGFIETTEAPEVFPLSEGKDSKFLTGAAAQSAFIKNYDSNGDGKIAKAEFVSENYPHYESRGIPLIPANWVAKD